MGLAHRVDAVAACARARRLDMVLRQSGSPSCRRAALLAARAAKAAGGDDDTQSAIKARVRRQLSWSRVASSPSLPLPTPLAPQTDSRRQPACPQHAPSLLACALHQRWPLGPFVFLWCAMP